MTSFAPPDRSVNASADLTHGINPRLIINFRLSDSLFLARPHSIVYWNVYNISLCDIEGFSSPLVKQLRWLFSFVITSNITITKVIKHRKRHIEVFPGVLPRSTRNIIQYPNKCIRETLQPQVLMTELEIKGVSTVTRTQMQTVKNIKPTS